MWRFCSRLCERSAFLAANSPLSLSTSARSFEYEFSSELDTSVNDRKALRRDSSSSVCMLFLMAREAFVSPAARAWHIRIGKEFISVGKICTVRSQLNSRSLGCSHQMKRSGLGVTLSAEAEMFDFNHFSAAGKNGCPFHHVLQFANVTVPCVSFERAGGVSG